MAAIAFKILYFNNTQKIGINDIVYLNPTLFFGSMSPKQNVYLDPRPKSD